MTASLPLVRYPAPDAALARRGEQTISCATYLGEVAAVAARLPGRSRVINLCQDRYRFAVMLGAALVRQQVTLLPPNATPGMLAQLTTAYPDLYLCRDTAIEAGCIQAMDYPDDLTIAPESSVPSFPADQPAIVLFTSGSTGMPQPQPRSWGALATSAQAAGLRLLNDGLAGATIVATVPHQHSYGIESSVMLGLSHGLVLDCGRPLLPGDIVTRLQAAGRPSILVTTPVHLKALVADTGDLPPVDLVVSATAPLTQDLAALAESRFRASLVEIYGCSEAGQLATRLTAGQAEWNCLDGITLRQEDGHTYASGEPVGSPQPLSDVIELHSPGRFLLRDRFADLVNIAGKRNSIGYLTHQLLAVPGVKDGVFLLPQADSARLMAFAVAPDQDAAAITAELRLRIDPAFLPRPLILVDALPRNSLGKLPREALLALAKTRS